MTKSQQSQRFSAQRIRSKQKCGSQVSVSRIFFVTVNLPVSSVRGGLPLWEESLPLNERRNIRPEA